MVILQKYKMDHLSTRKQQGSDHSEDTSSSESEEVEEDTSSSESEEVEEGASGSDRQELEGPLDQRGGIPKGWDKIKKRIFSLMNREVTARDTSGRNNVSTDLFCTVTGIQELFVAPIIENSMPGLLQLNTAPERHNVLIVSLKQPSVADEQYQPKLDLFWFLHTVDVNFHRILASEVVKQLMCASVPPSNAQHGKIDYKFSSDSIELYGIISTADLQLLAPLLRVVISTFFRDAWLLHLLSMEYRWEVREVLYKHRATGERMKVQLSVPFATVDMLVQPPYDDRHGSIELFPNFERDCPFDQSEQRLALLAECSDKGFIRIEPYDTHSDAARVIDTLKVLLL